MTKREVITLNESVPRLEAPQIGDTYQLPRDVYSTTGVLISEVADDVTADGFVFNTENALATSGAKIASFQNNGVEKASIDKDGSLVLFSDEPDTHTLTISATGYTTSIKSKYSLMLGSEHASDGVFFISKKNANVSNSNASIGWDGITYSPLADVEIGFRTNWGYDQVVADLLITGAGQYSASVTNLIGGGIKLTGGAGASASAGDAHGGDVTIAGGTGYGTGHTGYSLVNGTIYGIMSVQAGATSQDDIGTTPEILTAWNTDGLSNGMTVSHANDYITASVAGTYEVAVNISFSGTGSSVVDMEIYVYDDSGTSWGASGFAMKWKLGTEGDVGSASIGGIVALDTDDRIAVYVTTDGATDDITVVEAQLIAKRISN